jgi:uncharacterized membrane protein
VPNIFDKMARARTEIKIALLLSAFVPVFFAYLLNSYVLLGFAFVYFMAVYIPIYRSFIAPPKK